MKRLYVSLFLLSLSGLSFASSPTESKHAYSSPKHSESHQSKHYRHRDQSYKCFDAWNNKISGRFDQYDHQLIELAGGYCIERYQRNINNGVNGDLSSLRYSSIPVYEVHRAIRKIRREYRFPNSRFITAKRVKENHKGFKYTLVYEVAGQGIRKFRVKHRDRHPGEIKIREV